jgi:hypothetical protein
MVVAACIFVAAAGGVGDGVESPEKRTKKKKQSWIRGVGTLPQR